MAGHRLTEILDSIQDSNKRHTVEFSNSHLNQFKVRRKYEHQPWSSSQYKKQIYTTDEKTDFQNDQENKINALVNKAKQLPFLPLIEQKYSDPSLTDHDTKQSQTQASTSLKYNKADSFRGFHFTCPPIFMSPLTKCGFIPSCMLDVTKKDHYNSMNVSRNFLRQSKRLGKTAYSSSKEIVDILLKKLKQNLKDCPETGTTSDILKRLQSFSNIFTDLIINSPMFGTALHVIKIEYDNYISYLLDIYEKETQVLQGEVQEMAQHANQTEQLSEAEVKVEKLECKMIDLLLESKSLQKDINTEMERINAVHDTMATLYRESAEEIPETKQKLELYDDVETLRVAILEKLDELQTKKTDMRNNYVPISVCLQLEQCIKDTDMELHKWVKQNEYFKTSSAEMEGYLKEAIIEADTSERDVRRIWRKIYARKRIGVQVEPQFITNNDDNDQDDDEDDDDDDESKWNWYIS